MESYFERIEERTGLDISVEPQHLTTIRREHSDAQTNGTNTPAQHKTIPVTKRQRAETVVHQWEFCKNKMKYLNC